jgi:transcriptional regulator with XRE-family HTH domain
VKELRREKGWSQQYCADRIGVPRSTWAGYESGKKPKDKDLLVKIASLLDTNVDYLLGNTDNKAPIMRIQEEIESGTPDLLEIIQLGQPHIDGVPIDEETAKYLYYQLKALREKLLSEMENDKKKSRLGA